VQFSPLVRTIGEEGGVVDRGGLTTRGRVELAAAMAAAAARKLDPDSTAGQGLQLEQQGQRASAPPNSPVAQPKQQLQEEEKPAPAKKKKKKKKKKPAATAPVPEELATDGTAQTQAQAQAQHRHRHRHMHRHRHRHRHSTGGSGWWWCLRRCALPPWATWWRQGPRGGTSAGGTPERAMAAMIEPCAEGHTTCYILATTCQACARARARLASLVLG
jgi:hypothetical protein